MEWHRWNPGLEIEEIGMITPTYGLTPMKTSKIFESSLWKSAFFVYGLVAIGFSIAGIFNALGDGDTECR